MRIKKKVWIWLVVFLLLIVGYIIFFRKEKELIIWQENLNFEIKSEIKIKDIIKEATELEVKEVNIKVKDIEPTKNEVQE